MKMKILVGSLLAVCMLVILPTISAVETKVIEDENNSNRFESLIQKIRELFVRGTLTVVNLLLTIVESIFGSFSWDVTPLKHIIVEKGMQDDK